MLFLKNTSRSGLEFSCKKTFQIDLCNIFILKIRIWCTSKQYSIKGGKRNMKEERQDAGKAKEGRKEFLEGGRRTRNKENQG